MALLIVLIPAHLILAAGSAGPDSMLSNRNYFPGIFEALYWGISSLTSQAQAMPHRSGGARDIELLDVRRCGFCCAIYRPADRDPDGSADSRRHRGAG